MYLKILDFFQSVECEYVSILEAYLKPLSNSWRIIPTQFSVVYIGKLYAIKFYSKACSENSILQIRDSAKLARLCNVEISPLLIGFIGMKKSDPIYTLFSVSKVAQTFREHPILNIYIINKDSIYEEKSNNVDFENNTTELLVKNLVNEAWCIISNKLNFFFHPTMLWDFRPKNLDLFTNSQELISNYNLEKQVKIKIENSTKSERPKNFFTNSCYLNKWKRYISRSIMRNHIFLLRYSQSWRKKLQLYIVEFFWNSMKQLLLEVESISKTCLHNDPRIDNVVITNNKLTFIDWDLASSSNFIKPESLNRRYYVKTETNYFFLVTMIHMILTSPIGSAWAAGLIYMVSLRYTLFPKLNISFPVQVAGKRNKLQMNPKSIRSLIKIHCNCEDNIL